jgi:hypothetical protein
VCAQGEATGRAWIALASAGLLVVCSAAAGDTGVELSGRGEFRATYLDLDGGPGVIQSGEASDYWTVGGGGALDAAFGALNVQADFSGEATLDEGSANDTYQGSYGGGLHAGWRDPERGALGVFGAAGEFYINNETGPNTDNVAWVVGGEGQAYFDAVTLYLQAGYLDREPVSSGGDLDALKNAGFVRGVGRYFPTDDLKLELEGSYAQGKMDPDEDNVWIAGWGAEAEYRMRDRPIAGFVRYTGSHYNQDDDTDELTEHRFGFGFRVYFGRETLRAHDRRGASLDLPRYLEWNGQVAGALE